MRNVNLFNIGYLMADLPEDLFAELKDECVNAHKNNEQRITGMSEDHGCPTHYKLVKTKLKLQEYVKELAQKEYGGYSWLLQFAKSVGHIEGDHEVVAQEPWINYQTKHQVLPNHIHAGFISYSIWVNIPVLQEFSYFQFIYNSTLGPTFNHDIMINKHMEGKIILFPSLMHHIAYPFYTSDETRISVAGNLSIKAKG